MKRLIIIMVALMVYSATFAQTFTLKNRELGGQLTNKQFFNGMGFKGENLSPQLYWENEPSGTKSFAVTIYDMDAPTGSGFWHWVVFNIPSAVHELKQGAGDPQKNLVPMGTIQSNSDYGTPGYCGAAPNDGPAHRFLITVYAVGKNLDLDKNATPASVGFNLYFATLAKASMVVYGQKK
ncbi:YbhB/YbcL family Raf kinase inhibitor-like protein [Pedobacter sp. UBA5917]|uniref:YbhB/YbcL family Raf kinase inhibitor-like protein n=1 Tax=Pedobacter sp. UBA5917 TaxID=1947061 RepID=UPI0025DDB174|nr:YbhB/YbcL family Raf kinase inhibitor-like protein [Pedobacter sp. UBA5917]